MKSVHFLRVLLLGAVILFAVSIVMFAQDAAPAGDPAQAELDALRALTTSQPPAGLSGADHYRWFDRLTRKIGEDAFAFIARHPSDPRRWHAALILQQRRFHPRFVVSIADDYPTVGEKAVVRDTAAETAWSARVDELEKQLRAATDVPPEVREQVEFFDLMAVFQPAYMAAQEKRPFDLARVEQDMNAFLARWPDSNSGRGLLTMFVHLAKVGRGQTEADILRPFAESANRGARDYVRDRLRFFELSQRPFELKFTALDGREVDLTALRGKVVLIDFWATWCGPCIAELPNVKKAYAELHERGFEIVGISLDQERDRQKFAALVAKEGLPWPQRFAGKGWEDPVAKEYTVMAIPAMFLLDQKGMLVSADARGEKLAQEVRRLLGL